MTERNDLESLAVALFNAKNAEAEAKSARILAEEALAEAIGGKDNGSTTARCGRLNATVKRGYNYTIDEPTKFAEEHPDFIRVKYELAVKPYEDARTNHPDLFAELSSHVTVKPKKVSVELKV